MEFYLPDNYCAFRCGKGSKVKISEYRGVNSEQLLKDLNFTNYDRTPHNCILIQGRQHVVRALADPDSYKEEFRFFSKKSLEEFNKAVEPTPSKRDAKILSLFKGAEMFSAHTRGAIIFEEFTKTHKGGAVRIKQERTNYDVDKLSWFFEGLSLSSLYEFVNWIPIPMGSVIKIKDRYFYYRGENSKDYLIPEDYTINVSEGTLTLKINAFKYVSQTSTVGPKERLMYPMLESYLSSVWKLLFVNSTLIIPNERLNELFHRGLWSNPMPATGTTSFNLDGMFKRVLEMTKRHTPRYISLIQSKKLEERVEAHLINMHQEFISDIDKLLDYSICYFNKLKAQRAASICTIIEELYPVLVKIPLTTEMKKFIRPKLNSIDPMSQEEKKLASHFGDKSLVNQSELLLALKMFDTEDIVGLLAFVGEDHRLRKGLEVLANIGKLIDDLGNYSFYMRERLESEKYWSIDREKSRFLPFSFPGESKFEYDPLIHFRKMNYNEELLNWMREIIQDVGAQENTIVDPMISCIYSVPKKFHNRYDDPNLMVGKSYITSDASGIVLKSTTTSDLSIRITNTFLPIEFMRSEPAELTLVVHSKI